jgi:hypothetical protein
MDTPLFPREFENNAALLFVITRESIGVRMGTIRSKSSSVKNVYGYGEGKGK